MPLRTAVEVTGFTTHPPTAPTTAPTTALLAVAPESPDPGTVAVVPERLDPGTVAALAAATGDPAAQRDFVCHTQPEVWRFVASLVDPGSADDLTQETYLRAFRALPTFEGRSTARTWLLGIARRACADHIRSLQRRRRFESAVADTALLDALASPDHAGWHSAADLLRALPDDRRAAFLLTQLIGLSYAEVAQIEGVPVGTIRSRVARARMQLVDAVHAARAR